jgi:hypothetical protein
MASNELKYMEIARKRRVGGRKLTKNAAQGPDINFVGISRVFFD